MWTVERHFYIFEPFKVHTSEPNVSLIRLISVIQNPEWHVDTFTIDIFNCIVMSVCILRTHSLPCWPGPSQLAKSYILKSSPKLICYTTNTTPHVSRITLILIEFTYFPPDISEMHTSLHSTELQVILRYEF